MDFADGKKRIELLVFDMTELTTVHKYKQKI